MRKVTFLSFSGDWLPLSSALLYRVLRPHRGKVAKCVKKMRFGKNEDERKASNARKKQFCKFRPKNRQSLITDAVQQS